MKSRTSFFNSTAFRKDILRYSPIWALYTIFLLLVLFGEADYSRAIMARDMVDSLQAMTWVNLIYGGICGVFLFMDLFNSRLCNAIHAFPMRREGWLTTHLISGFLFSFVPNLLLAGISALLLWEYAYIAPIWLAISTLQFIFFFGTAALAATCAGNLLGTAAVYGITHLITLFIYAVAELFYQPLLYGVKLNGNGFLHFLPLNEMGSFDYADMEVLHDSAEPVLKFSGLEWPAFRYAGICAAVGILAMFLACLVYRRRNLESAGDFISLRPLAPLFILVCTIGAGAFLYLFSDLVENKTYLFLALGMIIGYFAGKMLLNRTLKVFGKKSILTLVALMVIFGGSMLVTWLDPLGIETYVPKAENIEKIYLYGADKGYYYSDSFYTGMYEINENGFAITDAEEIADMQNFHRQLAQYRYEDGDGTRCRVQISYKLQSGKIVNRYYEVGRDTPLGEKAGAYFSDMRYIFETNDIATLHDNFKSALINIYYNGENDNYKLIESQEISGLLDAIAKDCQAGKMAQNWAYHEEFDKDADIDSAYVEGYIEFYVNDIAANNGYARIHLQIYSDSTNTVEYMKAMAEIYAQQQEQPDEPILDPIPE